MKQNSGLGAVNKLNSPFATPITPVPTQPDVTPALPSGGTDFVRYSTSVRDSAAVRQASAPEVAKSKTAQEQANDDQWQLLMSGWGRR